MNRRYILNKLVAVNLFLFSLASNAQTLTLDSCRTMARNNYPAIRQYELIEQSRDLTVSNIARTWLPGVSVTGFGLAMTDVLGSSPLGSMENSIYGASLSVNQVIYDGGAIGAQRRVARSKAEVETNRLDVEIYSIYERIEQLFFGILMIDEQLKQMDLLKDNLHISERTVKSMIAGGMANENDLDQVHVNEIQADQQIINLNAMRKTYSKVLCYFIGRDASDADLQLAKPLMTVSTESNRPELALFSSQENLLAEQQRLLDTRLMPTLSAFGMAAYHNKMMPVVNDKNLMAGVMLKWNIGALYTRSNDKESLENQRQQIAVQRETFLFNNNMQKQRSNGQIEALREQMTLDDKAVALREAILAKAQKKVEQGTQTVNELLRDVNAVSEARQQRAIHEIELMKEICKLNTIKGL